jgi:multidrug efflux system membrane fusion protein
VEINAVGNVEAFSTIVVRARIEGQLMKVHFREGDNVKKGDRLFLIDPRPYDEAIRQAEANLARDQALLRQAEANLQRDMAQEKYARAQAARYQQLFVEGVIAKQQADQFLTDADVKAEAVKADRAAIESARSAVRADMAALDNARLQRSYCEIFAPVDGRAGELKIKEGNLVKTTDAELVTLNQIHPVFVTFSVPEKELRIIRKYMQSGSLKVLASPPGSTDSSEVGRLSFIDNQVDQTTGTVKLKGTFPNAGTKLWPGEFVNVRLRLTEQPNASVVPSQAVQTGQTGDYVYVLRPDATVEARPVVSGIKVGELVVIEHGLKPGEKVVKEGQLRLAPGMRVTIKGD